MNHNTTRIYLICHLYSFKPCDELTWPWNTMHRKNGFCMLFDFQLFNMVILELGCPLTLLIWCSLLALKLLNKGAFRPVGIVSLLASISWYEKQCLDVEPHWFVASSLLLLSIFVILHFVYHTFSFAILLPILSSIPIRNVKITTNQEKK